MSTFSKGDSVLGNHSADLAIFEATADPKSCSISKQARRSFFRKFAKNRESTTAKRSFFRKQATAVQGGGTQAGFFRAPRILEEEKSSLRADNGGVAIHKNAQKSQSVASLEKADSSMDCHDLQSKSRNDKKEVDCHAIATALARNDRKNATSKKVDKKVDSSNEADSKRNAKNLSDSQAAGLCDNDTKAENAFDSQVAGGRIFDEKAGLCSGEQGDKTRVSIDAASHKLPAFSQKANAQTTQSRIA